MILLILYICKTLSNTNKDNIVGGNTNTQSSLDESDILDEIIHKRLTKNISNGGSFDNLSNNTLELSESDSNIDLIINSQNKSYNGGVSDILDKEVTEISDKINQNNKDLKDINKKIKQSNITSKTITTINDSEVLYNNLYSLLMDFDARVKSHLAIKKEQDFFQKEKTRLTLLKEQYQNKWNNFTEEQKTLGKSILSDIDGDLLKIEAQLTDKLLKLEDIKIRICYRR